ncbi:unnamed protein product [Echinostoma caproni]|uniref:DUF659 domain-containing protein n=1 Tax=Echinostoma caproni TaxID=27848 RepID=A0A183AWK2_9TREM|nr:unnamed protein product [Echinostoma caproni]
MGLSGDLVDLSVEPVIVPYVKDKQLTMKAEVYIFMIMHLTKKAWVSVHPYVLINAFMKAGFESTLMQQPEDKCDLIENFTQYVSIVDRVFEEEIACLEFYDGESLDEFVSNQAKHRKEDECEAVNAPEVISIREAHILLDQLKLFALANAQTRSSSPSFARKAVSQVFCHSYHVNLTDDLTEELN